MIELNNGLANIVISNTRYVLNMIYLRSEKANKLNKQFYIKNGTPFQDLYSLKDPDWLALLDS